MGPAAAAAMDPAVLRERLVLALRARALGNRFSSGKALVSKLLRAHDKSGTGSLDYASFGKALAATCNLVLGAPDMEGLFEYYANSSEGGGGGVDIDTLLGAALEDDYGDDRGIMDYPSGECGASSKNLRGRPDEIMMAIRNDLRRNFKSGKGLHKTPQAMFDAADASGNGAICLREFKVALRGPLSLGRGHDEALELLFRQCDADRSGEICFREFERHLLLVRPQDGLPKPDCQSMPLAAVRRVFKDNVTRVCQKKQCKGEVFDRQHFRALFEAGRGNAGVGWPVFRKVCEQILESIAPADVVKLYRSLQPLGLATPIPTHVLLQLVAPSDISGGRGILDYPSDDPGGGAPPSYPKMALIAIRTEVQKQIKATHGRSDRLLELFDRADADGTGSICRLAFKVALRGPHGHGSGHEAALDLLFDAADTNGNGVISFAEFSRELTRAVDNPDLSEGNQKMDLARLSTIFRDKLGEYSKRRGRWTAVANPDTIRRFFHELCPPSRKAGRNGRAPAEGAMSFATFLQICKHKLHINNVNDADLRELFRVFDRDNSGSIDCNEFLTAAFPADFTHEKGEMIWDEEVVSLGLVDEGHASVTQLALMRAQKAKASKPGHIDIGQRTVTPQMLSARRS
jgi:Ca2+-binding EF-hand superfamily protein